MPYVIKKTDGSIVATVTDGTVDSTSTSIKLIGKNYKGIGEIYNRNLVQLLENFANSAPPNNQIKGQLWFNTSSNKLNVYDGTNWRPVGSPFVTSSKPGNLVQGDLWIDNTNKQLKFFDGSNLITAGPIYTSSQGKTGWEVEEIVDSAGNTNIVASMYVRSIRMAILNAASFVPLIPIDGFTTGLNPLKAGLTFSSNVVDNNINAPSEGAQALIDPTDGNLTSDKFVRSDKSSSISGSLTLEGQGSAEGLIIGPESNITLFIDTTGGVGNYSVCLASQVENSKLVLQVKDADGFKDAIRINPANKSVSVYPDDIWQISGATPQFLVNGDTTIQGSLTVVGPTQFTNSTTVQISDKNIELAVTENPTNTTANGSGITIQGGTNNDKTLRWLSTGILVSNNPPVNYSTWEVNDNFKIPNTNSYYIGNNSVLSTTTLGSTVVNSSLTSVGSLVNLNVAKFNFTNNVLSITELLTDLEISVNQGSKILLTNRARISNVDDPLQQFDATNKQYVDNVKTSINYLTIDITGLASPNVDAVPQISALIPPTSVNVGDLVRVLCLSYSYTNPPPSSPTVTRVLKVFECDDASGPRTWKHRTSDDINIL